MAHRTQGNFLFTRLSVYYKKCNSGTARWKRCIGPGMGEGAQSFHVLSRQPSSQHLCAFSSPEPLWTPSFGVFMKAPLCSQEWLNHCTLSLIQPSVLLYSPEVWGMGLKVPTLQLWLVPPGNQPPSLGAFQNSPHEHKLRCYWKELFMNNKRHLFPHHSGNFRSSVPRWSKD